ncbi:MAG TPA: CPBP family intramembrane glutamic endopeptidase [Nocardioidaceae bacterium]|nr:CPBP family intramembrane glutamic endopeptidase [Nocardioidaceae bacterium]
MTAVGRRLLLAEVVLVLALSLGRSAVYAVVNLLEAATAPGALGDQQAVLNGSLAPGRVWFDLVYQLLSIGFGVVPVLLVAYLMARSQDDPRGMWSRGAAEHRRDLLRGLGVAAVVGSTGLAFYLATYLLGVNLTVVAEDLPSVWWRYPVLVLSALQNALLEEVVMIGYLLTRLRQLGVSQPVATAISALVRGAYHLYQGLGGFVGNAAMGLLFGWLYARWGRVTPLVVAHTALDVVAFIGYAVLAGRVSWLPT